MALNPPVRKALLTAHVLASVGWVGAVLVYLALGIAAVSSADTTLVRAAFVAMDWAAWVVLVPLAVASLVTGVLQSLTTKWGLWRHYWVIFKLAITAVATAVLLTYTGTLDQFATIATAQPFTGHHLGLLRSPSVIVHSTGALLLLLTATVLAVYKPNGLTRRGHRLRQQARPTT
jgi:hypothetical protein